MRDPRIPSVLLIPEDMGILIIVHIHIDLMLIYIEAHERADCSAGLRKARVVPSRLRIDLHAGILADDGDGFQKETILGLRTHLIFVFRHLLQDIAEYLRHNDRVEVLQVHVLLARLLVDRDLYLSLILCQSFRLTSSSHTSHCGHY